MGQGGGGWHDAVATVASALVARFDGQAMRVVPAVGAVAPHDAAALQAWCLAGAGSVGRPDVPFAVAVLAGDGASRVAAAFSRQLDGTDRLEALPGRAARWRLRLAVKWADLQWWRPRRPDDPWDCGLLVDEPAVHAQLARFQPRRATLMLADGWPPAALHDGVRRLHGRQALFRHPVRLLVTGAAPAGLAVPVQRLQVQPASPG